MIAVRIFIIGLLFLSCFTTALFASSTTTAAAAAVMAAPARPDLQRLRWKNKTVKIAVSSSVLRTNANIKYDSDVIGAIRRSLQAWAVAADFDLQMDFSDRQSVSPGGPAGDGVSLITIAQTPENVLFFSKDAESVSAKTRIFFNRKGFITEADIVLNPFQQFSTDGTFGTFDLESTLTHEIGHLLGLHHSAVLGSTMAESFAKNGTMGLADFGPRTLAESDIAEIRELYGAPSTDENCCGVISGKLIPTSGRASKVLQIWAEESESGRVIAQAESASDGTFRIGGLPGGEYSLYWQAQNSSNGTAMGKLESVSLEAGENKIINQKIAFRTSENSLQFLGVNGQLADYGISLVRSRSYIVNFGGRNLDARLTKIRVNTPYLRVLPFPSAPQQFGEGVSGISFQVTVDADIAPGQYTVFLSGENGTGSALVGAINIE